MKKIPSKKLSLSKIRIASLSKERQQTLKGGSIETFDRNCKTWYVECGPGPFTIARTCVE